MLRALPCSSSGGLRRNCILVYLSCLFSIENLDDWLTVHRSITLFDLQLDAQNSYLFVYIIHLLKTSTCFEHYPAHLQEVYVVTVQLRRRPPEDE